MILIYIYIHRNIYSILPPPLPPCPPLILPFFFSFVIFKFNYVGQDCNIAQIQYVQIDLKLMLEKCF